MLLESVNEEQHYVEDCEVCWRPIQLIYFYDNELRSFDALHLVE